MGRMGAQKGGECNGMIIGEPMSVGVEELRKNLKDR